MLIGEASCTKDMIESTDRDFQVVNAISILAIFISSRWWNMPIPFLMATALLPDEEVCSNIEVANGHIADENIMRQIALRV